MYLNSLASLPEDEGYGTIYLYDLETQEIEEIVIEDFNIDYAQWIVVE